MKKEIHVTGRWSRNLGTAIAGIGLLLIQGMLGSGIALADYLTDIHATKLVVELGNEAPTGLGVSATQVEATLNGNYMPDDTDGQLTGEFIIDKSNGDGGISSHATFVGRYYYGSLAIASAMTDIDVYEANSYLTNGFLEYGALLSGNPIQPLYSTSATILQSSPARITNHSWVGTTTSEVAGSVLRRLDFLVAADQSIQIVATNNGQSATPLLAGAYNAITVGRTDGNHPLGTTIIDDVYSSGRICPLLVVPMSTTSTAAPVVAAAAALLVDTGHNHPALSTDPEGIMLTNRDSSMTIYHAESALVVKSALLAGARRVTANTTDDEISDYRTLVDNRSANGMDVRYGAGQLDVFNSFTIISAGEQNSVEDEPVNNGAIDAMGFDYDPSFGGKNDSNTVATYSFSAGENHRRLCAALVWNLKIAGGTWNNYDDTATRYDLALSLTDITNPDAPRSVAASNSEMDTNENIWATIVPQRQYCLTVSSNQTHEIQCPYALAWHMFTPPDQDADGMDDDWEVEYGFNPLDSSDSIQDLDSDDLNNVEEWSHGTNPDNPDTDGDGFLDGTEVLAGSDPLTALDMPLIQSVPLGSAKIWWLMVGAIGLVGLRVLVKPHHR